MSGKICRGIVVLAALVLIMVGNGCSLSTEQAIYDIGVKAMKQDRSFSQGAAVAEAGPQGNCVFYVGKSAASVEIPYSFGGSNPSVGTYVVWLNRIGTRWELDRSFAVPKKQ